MRAKGILFLVAAIGCAAAVYLSTQGESAGRSIGSSEFSIRIENREIVGGSSVLHVDEGDSVVMYITTDEREKLHLHGYEHSVDLIPGTESELTFIADRSGRFPFELEFSRTELGAVEVSP